MQAKFIRVDEVLPQEGVIAYLSHLTTIPDWAVFIILWCLCPFLIALVFTTIFERK